MFVKAAWLGPRSSQRGKPLSRVQSVNVSCSEAAVRGALGIRERKKGEERKQLPQGEPFQSAAPGLGATWHTPGEIPRALGFRVTAGVMWRVAPNLAPTYVLECDCAWKFRSRARSPRCAPPPGRLTHPVSAFSGVFLFHVPLSPTARASPATPGIPYLGRNLKGTLPPPCVRPLGSHSSLPFSSPEVPSGSQSFHSTGEGGSGFSVSTRLQPGGGRAWGRAACSCRAAGTAQAAQRGR